MAAANVTLGRIVLKGQFNLDTQLKKKAATPTKNWDAEKDDRLLSCMANGDATECQHAFDAFYRRHKEYLYAICYNLANRYKFGFFDEGDLLQSTMIKASKHACTFKSEGIIDAAELEDKADAWLGGIAENVVIDLLRRKPKCVSIETVIEEEIDVLEIAETIGSEDIGENKLIREAIDTLTQNEKAVIWAASQFYECRENQRTPTQDLEEISKSLGISRDNFRKIKQRARKKIQIYVDAKKLIPK